MTPTITRAFTAADYKQMQRHHCGLAARGWREWWHLFESALQPVSDAMVELAAVGPRQRVLDLATGIGEPAVTAAPRAGRHGTVLGTDLCPQMLAIGEARAAKEGLANLAFHTMDAEWPVEGFGLNFYAAAKQCNNMVNTWMIRRNTVNRGLFRNADWLAAPMSR